MSTTCVVCGKDTSHRRRGARYCEDSCKQVRYRTKKAAPKPIQSPLPSPVESQMASTISWVEREGLAALERVKTLNCEAGLRELKQVLAKFNYLSRDSGVARILKLDAEEKARDPQAYYARTGLF